MDLSKHFPARPGNKTFVFTGTLPAQVKNPYLAPTLEWCGLTWDGLPNQLLLGRDDGDSFDDKRRAWNILKSTAESMGFTFVPNQERSDEDASMLFFDLEGADAFNPQEFIDRFTQNYYCQ